MAWNPTFGPDKTSFLYLDGVFVLLCLWNGAWQPARYFPRAGPIVALHRIPNVLLRGQLQAYKPAPSLSSTDSGNEIRRGFQPPPFFFSFLRIELPLSLIFTRGYPIHFPTTIFEDPIIWVLPKTAFIQGRLLLSGLLRNDRNTSNTATSSCNATGKKRKNRGGLFMHAGVLMLQQDGIDWSPLEPTRTSYTPLTRALEGRAACCCTPHSGCLHDDTMISGSSSATESRHCLQVSGHGFYCAL
ncbi:hypothetical protein H6P81_020640 [Aristolochia fimbriata]|uniref:Cytochrome c biogenesis B n=1 Tax=Aristolochia fimbriata TaxID=158543 RepID=A0AAV7DV18_ARIFI|nr:hypothetical protein H6P81_020640 [Aristolochia fimbriata]